MNEELLKLLYSKFKTDATFENFFSDIQNNEELQKLAYSKLKTNADFETFKIDLFGDKKSIKTENKPDLEETTPSVKAISQEDQYAAMSEALMQGAVPKQAKMTPQDTGATAEEVQAPISPRMKQRQRESDMASKSEDGSLGQGLYNPNTPEYIYGAENYKKTLELYNSRRGNEERMKMLVDGNVDIYEPSIDANLIKGKTRQIIDSKGLFKDFKPGNIIPEAKYNEVISSLIGSDKYMTEELPKDIIKANKSKIDEIQRQIESKYDLSIPSNFVRAENEFNQRVSDLVNYHIKNNKTVSKRISSLQRIASEAIRENDYELGRDYLASEYIGVGDSAIPFVEGLRKGIKQLSLGYSQAEAATDSEILVKMINSRESLDSPEPGNIFPDGRVLYGWEGLAVKNQELSSIAGEKGSIKDAKKYYDEEIPKKKAELLSKIKGLRFEESELEYFRKGDVDEVFSGENILENMQVLVGEQIPNMALARFSFGFGMLAPEFGGAYFDAIYQHLENNGLDINEENILKAIERGVGDSNVSATVSVVNSALEKVGADNIANAMFKGAAGNGVVRIVKDGFKQFAKSGGLKNIGKSALRGGFVEYLTEGAQATVNQVGKGVTLDDPTGYIDTKEIIKNAKTGGLIGFVLPIAGGATIQTAQITKDTYTKYSSKMTSGKMLDQMSEKYIAEIDRRLKAGETTEDKAETEKQGIREVRETQRSIPKQMLVDYREDTIRDLLEINRLKKEKEEYSSYQYIQEENDEKISELEQDINSRFIDSVKKKGILKKRGLTKEDSIKLRFENSRKTIDEIKEIYETGEIRVRDGKIVSGDGKSVEKEKIDKFLKSNATGQYLPGENVMLINENAKEESIVINVEAHEILHGVLKRKIGDKEAQANLVSEIKEILGSKRSKIMDEQLQNRYYNSEELRLRKKLPSISEEELSNKLDESKRNIEALEYLTVLSDSIADKTIKFDDSIFEKIIKFIQKILNTNSKSDIKIGFENGDQVLEFIKNFTKSFESGKLDYRVADALQSTPDVSGATIDEDLQSIEDEYSKLQDRYDSGEIDSEQYFDLLDELDKKEFKIKTKDSKKVDSKDFKKTLDDIGNKSNGFNFFDEKLESTLRKMIEIKAKNFRTKSGDIVNLENLPGFNMEDFTSEVYFNMMRGKKNKDGSYGAGYIQKFDPSINDSLYGYINAQLGNRMNNVLAEGQMTQEKFSTQIQEETFGEIEEYAFDEAIDEQLNEQYKEERNLIDPTTIFEDADFYNEVTEEVESQFMDTMAADLIFKNTKNLAIKSLAKKLKVRESVIEKASQNLNTTELIDTAPIIASIADKAIKILPEGAILDKGDGVAISEKIIGTGTGLPRKILDAYYVKTKRLLSAQEGIGKKGAGLEPFMKRDISKAEFLKELGILEDGTHNPDIKPKTPESQTRRAFIDLLGKLMTNTRGRMMMADQGVPLSQINDFAAGKSEDMFSQEGFTVEGAEGLTIGDVINKLRIANADAKGLLEGISNSMKNPIIKKQLEDYGINQKQIKDLLKAYKTYATIKGKQIYSYEGLMNVIEMSNKFSATLDPLLVETSSTSAKAYTGVYSKGFPSLESESSLLSGIKNQVIVIRRASGRIISPSAAIKMRNKYLNIGEKLSRKPRNVKSKEASVLRRNSSSELLKRLKSELNRIGQSKIPDLSKLKSRLTGTPTNRPTYSQRKKMIEADADKNNLARRYAREYLIAKLGDFIHEQGISKENRAARIAYMIHVLSVDSPSNSALKQLAEISKGYSLLSESTGFIQLEHLEATSKYNTEVFNAVMLNTLPSTTYEASFLDKRLSSKLDDSILKGGFGVKIALKEEKKDIIQSEDFIKAARDLNIEEDLFSKEANISMMQSAMANILKKKTGIPVSEEMSRVTAKLNSDRRNKKFRFMSPSADDFVGFLYSFLGKGKEGDAQMKFFTEKLIDPLNKAYVAMAAARQKITRDFKDLNKEYEDIKVSLAKDSGYKKYTNDQALRAYLYIKSGESNKTLNINDADAERFKQIVESNDRMMEYASYLTELVDNNGNWVAPKSQWQFGSIFEDVERIIDDVKRGKFMEEWNINAEAIFSENNMNKIEYYYGSDFRNALEDMLYRIEKGKAIPEKTNKEMSEFQKWLTGSVAVTMFFNTRSAVLQLISTINYVNWSDNNPIQAAKAFANIPQFAKDVAGIFNSDYLKERRGGLKTEVEAAVLANELRKGGVDGYRGFINKLLQKGFTFTQIGDSLAISFGGASFYRNRKNSYINQGMSEEKAKEQAWLDFIETTEQSQQSARPDKLSMQQTNSIGRIFLAFQNTPMQYYRLTTRAAQDLAAGRGDFKTNVSKIGYYSFVQGLIFSALQQSLFAFLGDAPDDEEKKEKFEAERERRVIRTVNNTLDTMLRGSGLRGAYVATAKNAILEFITQEKKGYKADHTRTLIEVLNLSAPVGIKSRTLYQGAYMNYKYNRDIIEDIGFDIDNPGYDIVGSLLSAGVNIPMDKVINDIRQLKEAADSEHDAWQRIALALGWSTWNLGIENKKVRELSEKKTKEKKEAAKKKREKEPSGWGGSKKSGW